MNEERSEKISTATCDIVPDFDLYIKKRIDLHQGYYSCEQIHKFAIDLFILGIEFAHHWNNCYINPPQEDHRVVLCNNGDSSGNQYYICDYRNKKFYDVIKKTPVQIYSDSKWYYLNYPTCIK